MLLSFSLALLVNIFLNFFPVNFSLWKNELKAVEKYSKKKTNSADLEIFTTEKFKDLGEVKKYEFNPDGVKPGKKIPFGN